MHISEGILSVPVLISGAALAAIGTSIGLKKLDYEKIPQTAVLSAAFFVASLVHVPIGPGNIHLVLSGLMGIFLGWAAFPVILTGLILQALLFQYGGITTLGVNAVIMALPAVICFYLFRWGIKSSKSWVFYSASFFCGFTTVSLSGIIMALCLLFTGEQFTTIAKLIVSFHIPVMFIEGIITTFSIKFIKQVRPEMMEIFYENNTGKK